MGGTTEAIRLATSLANKEATFGTVMTLASLTDMFVLNSFNPAVITPTYRTDENKINGTRGKTQRQRANAEGQLDIPVDASVELIAWALAMGYGNDSVSGGGDPYTHTIKHPPVCTLAPPSTSFLQGIVCSGLTTGYKSYKGCSVNQIAITMNGQGPVELSVQLKLDGSETTQSGATFPTTFLSLSYLLGSMTTFKLYPNGGSALELSAGGSNQLQSLKITIDFGLTKLKRASNTVYVPGWRWGKGKPNIKVEFVIAGDKSDVVYGYFAADTLLTLQAIFTYTSSRLITLDMSNCYITAKENADDIEPTLECAVDEIDVIANQGPAIWIAKTGVAAYLVGLP